VEKYQTKLNIATRAI